MQRLSTLWLSVLYLVAWPAFAQNVSLYHQFYGKYDFTFVGNTLNPVQNGGCPATILTSSSATLNLSSGDVVASAYLYWAGSGTGDFNVSLNGQFVMAQRTFGVIQTFSGMPHFSAFADVTSLVQQAGNGNYTLSDLDLTAIIPSYCSFGGNFGGWAIVVVYQNNALPINQLNVYDGLQAMPDFIDINLTNLNVVDPQGAQIGMIAWEGDDYNLINETMRINGNILSNPPLNPANNAFNGTNSFTNSAALYNMDLDFYNIENYINSGDTSAQVQLTSGFDFVMVSTVVTKINSQLPDAVVTASIQPTTCDSKQISLAYTISNIGTNPLPAGTSVRIDADATQLFTGQTNAELAPGTAETQTLLLDIPDNISDSFVLLITVDQNTAGQGMVPELDESNNTFTIDSQLYSAPEFNLLPDLTSCNSGLGTVFDFAHYEDLASVEAVDTVLFFSSQQDAEFNSNAIENTGAYTAAQNPMTIFVRIQNQNCYALTSFELRAVNCPPKVYNYVSANADGYNDAFFIDGLYDVFLKFKLSIFNRWGKLIWTGNNNSERWSGSSNQGFIPIDGKSADGTYFYVLELNEPGYPAALNGYLYYKK